MCLTLTLLIIHIIFIIMLISEVLCAKGSDRIGFQQQNVFPSLDGRVHTVANFIGGDAQMPCEIDHNGCGNIYFITWTKNVSNEWQRVFLYSEAYQKVLGDLQANAAHRVTFRGDSINRTGIAYLTISSLSVVDEGIYKCDVTYTRPNINGKCPSLTYTRIQTLVKPGKPIIRVNGHEIRHQWSTLIANVKKNISSQHVSTLTSIEPFTSTDLPSHESIHNYQQPQVGPFSEGSTIVFECSTSGGRPLPDVRWWNGSKPMRSKITIIDDSDDMTLNGEENVDGPMVVSTMRIIATRYDLGAKFECRVWNNATVAPMSSSVKPDIQVKPLSLKVRGPTQAVVAGEMVSLTCTVEGARPAANITWYNRSEVVHPHPSSSTDLMSDGTYRTSSTLVFIASRHDHSGDFFCKGSNQVLRNRNDVPLLQGIHLKVLYPPAVYIQPHGAIVVNESSYVTLWCAFDANPPNVTEIVWYRNGHTLPFIPKDSSSVNSQQKLYSATDIRGVPMLTINSITRNDTGDYSCHLKNAFGRGNSTGATHVDVTYPPVVIIQLEPNVVLESSGTLVRLRCITVEGNPQQLAMAQWYMNGQYIETTYQDDDGGDTMADQLVMANVTRTQAGNYSCRGFNGAANASKISAPRQLSVLYTPGTAVLSINGGLTNAIKGSSVTLECQFTNDDRWGNPRAESYVWMHNGKVITDGQLTAETNTFITGPNDVNTRGEYKCAGVNQVGQGKWGSLWLDVKAPPRLIQGLPMTFGYLQNQTLTLSCRIECNPLCSIQWFRNNQSIGNSNNNQNNNYHIETVENEPDERSGLLGSLTSYLNVLNTTAIEDNDVIMCQSDDNELGAGVKSSMTYKVEYAPHNVQISVPRLELMEGDAIAHDLIKCKATVNPFGTYYWTKINGHSIYVNGDNVNDDSTVIANGTFLTFNNTSSLQRLTLTRQHSGNYTCVVSNSHGMSSATMTLSVLYRPECQLRREYIFDGRSILACDAVSNPPVINFTWFKGNRTISEVTSSSGTSSGITDSSLSDSLITSVIGTKQSAVLVLSDQNLESYYCVASNSIGASVPCKLQVQQIASAPSGWVQQLLADENLIIVAAAAGVIVFLLASSAVIMVICSAKRKFKGLTALSSSSGSDQSGNGQQYSPNGQHYSSTLVQLRQQKHLNASHKFALINKLPITEERSIPDGRCDDIEIIDDSLLDCSSANLCTPQNSPFITSSTIQCVQLIPVDGSPLLCSDELNYQSDDEQSPSPEPMSSSSSSHESMHHHYDQPIHNLNHNYNHHNRNHYGHYGHTYGGHRVIDYNILPPRPPPPQLMAPQSPINFYSMKTYISRTNILDGNMFTLSTLMYIFYKISLIL